jgi:hypothetical protein
MIEGVLNHQQSCLNWCKVIFQDRNLGDLLQRVIYTILGEEGWLLFLAEPLIC